MPQLNRKVTEDKKKQTGRGLGKCRSIADKEALKELHKGMGLHRKADDGSGLGKRLKSRLK